MIQMFRAFVRPVIVSAAVCTTAYALAPQCKAESPTLRRLRDNFEKNKVVVASQTRDDVLKWSPLRSYAHVLANLDESAIFDLSHMKTMYSPPLRELAKSIVYNKIIDLMKKAKTPEEEQMYVHLAKWYGIVD